MPLRAWSRALALLLLLPTPVLAVPLKLVIQGLEREPRSNLAAHIGVLDASLAAQPERLQRILAHALPAALRPYGYYAATFSSRIDGSRLRLRVAPGTRVLFTAPDLRVDPALAALPPLAVLLTDPPFTAGKPLSHPAYDDFRNRLLEACKHLGFFDARYRVQELRVDPAQGTARAHLELEAGPRYRFGRIEVSGSHIEPRLLDALAPFTPGAAFDDEQVRRFERRLRDTAWFRDVVVSVHPQPDAQVIVRVLAEDMQTSRYDLGAGYSTDSAVRLRFNRDTPLLNPAGHALRIEAELSQPRQNVTATWRLPHRDPLDDYVELSAALQGEDVQDTASTTATAGVRHTLKLGDDWSYSYGINAEYERYAIASATQKDVTYLVPQTSLSRTRLERGIDPRRGSAWWTAIDFSDRFVGAPADFVRWRGSVKWLFGLPDGNTTVFTRVELGALFTDGFSKLPASVRFHAGGDNSVRGYDFESLSPRDANGKLTGGRYLGVGSIELARRVSAHWRLGVFADGGSAFNSGSDRFHRSVGIGLRWLSPIGQVRFDLAMPVADGDAALVKLHISMGPPL